MQKFWNTKNEKIIISVGTGLVAYSVLSSAFTSLPQLPTFFSKPLFAGVNLIIIGAGVAIYGIYTLWTKY